MFGDDKKNYKFAL